MTKTRTRPAAQTAKRNGGSRSQQRVGSQRRCDLIIAILTARKEAGACDMWETYRALDKAADKAGWESADTVG